MTESIGNAPGAENQQESIEDVRSQAREKIVSLEMRIKEIKALIQEAVDVDKLRGTVEFLKDANEIVDHISENL